MKSNLIQYNVTINKNVFQNFSQSYQFKGRRKKTLAFVYHECKLTRDPESRINRNRTSQLKFH